MNDITGKRKFMSSLELFLYCATENFGTCSKLLCFVAEGEEAKNNLYLKLLNSRKNKQNKRKNIF